MTKSFANGRTIVHKGDGGVQTCPIPDVCKTPSPGGPVPIPYVNVAKTGDLSKGTKTVKITGKSVAIDGASLSTSTGDEAGTAGGGVISSKTKGKMSWASASADVKVPGSSRPGNCAAPKLVFEARRQGLTPVAMTEAWHGPAPPSGAPFSHGEHAESCDTCKQLLPAMLCTKSD